MGCCCRRLRDLLSSLLLICCCYLSASSSQAASSISQGQSITDGQTIVSPDGVFALGFFNTSKSSKRYLGIWYNKISIPTFVWVANGDKPVADFSGTLTFGSTGDLELRDGNGNVLWSTNSTTSSTSSWNTSTALLDDSGSLILKRTDSSNSSRVVWQSFDQPTDTFLPGMRVELDLKTGKNQLFTSWKAADDPSPGNFTLGLDPSGTAQIIIWENGSTKRWRSGQWNGQIFTGITNMRPLNLYGFKLTNEDGEGKMHITYTSFDRSTLLRFVIRWDGREEQLQWNDSSQTWSVIWTQATSECEIYGKCGVFGVCSADGRSPICSCLRGFDPRSAEEWRNGDWRGGCVRRRELGCGRNESTMEEDGFVRVTGVKLPDSSDWNAVNGGREECEEKCLGNCSCRAYAYVSGIGCLIWGVDLMDIRTFEDGGNDIYLRLAHSELGESKISKKVLIVIVVFGAVFLILCAFGLWRWRAKLKGCWKKGKVDNIPMFDLRPSQELSTEFSGPYEFGEVEQGKVPELTYFNFSCVANATDNFSDENKLGQGGFGPVYKGQLPGGQEIAVKRLSKTSGQGLEEFKNEVILIAKLQHRNLVRLLGCCIQGDERILLYEYMPNKSLDCFLFDSTRQSLLDWTKRFSIIEGIARGLLYLHRDSRLRIIHRDLKASNILLDEEMTPKISDFGMARIFGGNQNHANTNRVVGTYGYMSPEYAMEGLFSIKSDVYSFGVLILEIISGKKNHSTYHHGDDAFNLLGHAWRLWNEDRGIELIDPSLGNSYSVREVLRCMHVGLLCVQDHAADRPNMSSVVLMLESEIRNHPHPRPPTYSVGYRREIEPLHSSERYLTNDATMTMVFGR